MWSSTKTKIQLWNNTINSFSIVLIDIIKHAIHVSWSIAHCSYNNYYYFMNTLQQICCNWQIEYVSFQYVHVWLIRHTSHTSIYTMHYDIDMQLPLSRLQALNLGKWYSTKHEFVMTVPLHIYSINRDITAHNTWGARTIIIYSCYNRPTLSSSSSSPVRSLGIASPA